MKRRISTIERHECEKISGKVWCLAVDISGHAFCNRCGKEVLWTQVADRLQKYQSRRGR